MQNYSIFLKKTIKHLYYKQIRQWSEVMLLTGITKTICFS